jgi:hypothetical protein
MGRIAAKVDGNHNEIVDALRATGVGVQSLAEVGDGCPDLLCGVNGHTFVIEVKMPGEPLRPKQKDWHCRWPGRCHVADSIDSALFIADCYRKIAPLVL